jgi:hypothetical protein
VAVGSAGAGGDRAEAPMNQPAYCILRAEKLTSFGSITGSAMHTFREIPTPNADARRTHLNKTFGAQDAAAVREAIKARLPAKRRKDAVLAIEYLVTASPEWFRTASTKEQNAYFAAAVRWLEARHGKANIVCVNVQLDETSPHLVVYVVPLTKDGRLSAKDFLGGRKILTQMQTEFAELVGKPVGLQRGIEGSKATHTTAKQYAAALQKNPALVAPAPPAPTIADRLTGRAKQMEETHAAVWAKHVALVEQARSVAEVSRHARAGQAAALEQLRQKVEEGKQHEAYAARLRAENQLLKRELQEQRTYFQRQIADLKAALAKALGQVKHLLAKVGLLTRQRDQAEANSRQVECESHHPRSTATAGTFEEKFAPNVPRLN